MKLDITSHDGANGSGHEGGQSIELDDAIFGLEPRQDLIARMIRYQLAKRRAGTHHAKGRSEIWRTGKKLGNQKGLWRGSSRLASRAAVPRRRPGSWPSLPRSCS